jgi:hypothetical protein
MTVLCAGNAQQVMDGGQMIPIARGFSGQRPTASDPPVTLDCEQYHRPGGHWRENNRTNYFAALYRHIHSGEMPASRAEDWQ